ncbi:MAG: hypothetical protein M3Y25_00820 [Thermoproteota archaeon]|nr:hypothetical protein [Thermoproteota archaeon]
MLDLLIITSSAALGIICSIFIYRFISVKDRDKPNLLGNVKTELNNLYFEKSVALEALSKVKQFFDEKKIDEYERDRLSQKYINMLDNYNKRVFQLNPILEAQEIYEYKKQLDSIISEYTKKIDSKLAKLIDDPEFYKNKSRVTTTPTLEPALISTSGSKVQNKGKDQIGFFSTLVRSLTNRIVLMKHGLGKNKRSLEQRAEIKENKQGLDDKIQSDVDRDTRSSSSSSSSDVGIAFNNEIDQNSISVPERKYNPEKILETLQPEKSDKNEKKSIDANEIDKIQSDILKTLKRLEES